MWRPLIVVVLTLNSFTGIAQNNPLKPDGRMWAAWSTSGDESMFVKAAYVQGVIAGLRTGTTMGYFQGRLDESSDFLDYVKRCEVDKGHTCPDLPARLTKPEVNLNENMAGADKVWQKLAPQNATLLDIVRQMDKFYSDYRNTPVCLVVAVQESISSLNGTPSSKQGLEMARKGCNP